MMGIEAEPARKWLGVRTEISDPSVPTYARGRVFKSPSTSANAVCNCSKEREKWEGRAWYKAALAAPMSRSNTPP